MAEEIAAESTEANETAEPGVTVPENADEAAAGESEGSYSREFVDNIRSESRQRYERAKTAESRATAAEERLTELAKQLFDAKVRATGRLADPSDLSFEADLLDNPEALNSAIDALLQAKPHLAARKPMTDIGQGARGAAKNAFNLLETMKTRI